MSYIVQEISIADYSESLSTPELLCRYLIQNGVDEESAELLKEEGVSGITFPDITEDDLKELHIKLGPRKRIIQLKNEILKKKQGEEIPLTLEEVISKIRNEVITPDEYEVVTPEGFEILAENQIKAERQAASGNFEILVQNPNNERRRAISREFTHEIPLKIREWVQSHPLGQELIERIDLGIYQPCDRQLLIRIICGKLMELIKNLYPSSQFKDKVAREIVKAFPLLKSPKGEGHESFYDINTGMGFIDYRLKTMRKKLSPSEKKNVGKTLKTLKNVKLVSTILSCDELEKKIIWMKFKPPTQFNKTCIVKALKETMRDRQQELKESTMTVTDILQRYPRLKDYKGEMIVNEFAQLYRGGDKFLRRFVLFYVPRILKYVSSKRPSLLTKLSEYEDNLKSLFVLPELLPPPNYGRGKKLQKTGNYSSKFTKLKEREIPSPALIKFLSAQEDLAICIADTDHMHPYIICAEYSKKSSAQYYMKVGSSLIPLNEDPMQAFDILFKTHFVLNVKYAKELENFYNFVTSCIYEITKARASSDAFNTILINMPIDNDT